MYFLAQTEDVSLERAAASFGLELRDVGLNDDLDTRIFSKI